MLYPRGYPSFFVDSADKDIYRVCLLSRPPKGGLFYFCGALDTFMSMSAEELAQLLCAYAGLETIALARYVGLTP